MKKRLTSILLVLSMILAMINVENIHVMAANNKNGRLINVVYDDSGSMVKNGEDYILRWSQAKYAVEVFTAMMGSSDEMNIYPMSLQGGLGLTLTGTDKDRVSKIHNMNARYSNTPFTTVDAAAQNLMDSSTDKEKWLVIITDGEFDDGATPLETVYSKIDECTSSGIKVIYLAIGENASNLSADNTKGFYSEKASDGPDVLDKVMKMANQIFTHMILPDDRISNSGGVAKLDIDIPVNKVMVFAQGDNVSINGVKHNGEKINPVEVENVKYSDVTPENYPDAIVDTSLKGVIATYESSGNPYESGNFEVDVTGAQNIQYYYSPGVEVNCDLYLNGNIVSQDEEIYAGNYEIGMNFIDPTNGNVVESELLSDAVFSLSVENNGSTQTVDGTKGNVSLVEGEVILDAVAYLPGEVTLSNEKKYTVLPEPQILNLDVQKNKSSYSADDIANGKEEFLLTVTDADTGNKLTEDEWDNTSISIDDSSGIAWDAVKGDEVSTWKLVPKSQDGTIASTPVGDFTITVSADYQIDNQYAFGSTQFGLSIAGYEGDSLIVELENTTKKYTMDNLEKEGEIIARVYLENDETKEKEVISEDLWNALEFSASTKAKLNLVYEKGNEVGAFKIHPKYYKSDPLKTKDGDIDIHVEAKGTEGELQYKGAADGKINIEKLSRHRWLVLMAPKLIALAILLFILIGYIKKNRIKTKGMNPHNAYKGKISGKRKIKKKFLSVIIPYIDEVAIVQCRNPGYECHFPNLTIKATSKNTFKIKNGNIDVKTILINGAKIADMKDLKKQNFNYSGFQITSIDTKNNNKKLGSFTFR